MQRRDFRVTSGGREDGPSSAGPNCHSVVAAVAQFHCHPAHTILDPSFRPESVTLVVCSVLMQLRQAGKTSSAPAFRLSFSSSTFQYLVSHLAFKPAGVETLSKTLGIVDGKEPVGTFTALDTPAFEDLVSVVKFGTETDTLAQSGRLRRLCDAV